MGRDAALIMSEMRRKVSRFQMPWKRGKNPSLKHELNVPGYHTPLKTENCMCMVVRIGSRENLAHTDQGERCTSGILVMCKRCTRSRIVHVLRSDTACMWQAQLGCQIRACLARILQNTPHSDMMQCSGCLAPRHNL